MSTPDLGVSNIDIDNDVTVMPGGESAVIDTPAPQRKTDRLAKYAKRVWIVLEDNDNIPPTGQFFGHNGEGFMLVPGRAAHVPVEILDILNNAVYAAPEVDQQTRQIIGYRDRLRFPYRIVQAPRQ